MKELKHLKLYEDFSIEDISVNEELSTLQQEYREFFRFMLDCYDVKSQAQLSDDKKKEFFNNISKYWVKGKGLTKDLEDIKEDICGENE